MPYPHLFEPLDLGPFTLRNRVMMTVHGDPPGARSLPYYEARAAGGAGLLCVPGGGVGVRGYQPVRGPFLEDRAADVDAVLPDPVSPEGIAYFDRVAIPVLRGLAQTCHRHGAAVVSQVYHLGGTGGYGYAHPGLSPSGTRDETYGMVPHALSVAEIETVVEAFGHCARRVREAGLDGVEIHAAHGYLVHQFLSPATNHRTDAYGGSPDGRLRLLAEILAAIDRLAGPDFPVGLRINGAEGFEGGLGVHDVAGVVGAVAGRLTYLNVSGGTSTGQAHGLGLAYAGPWLAPDAHNAGPAAALRLAVGLPVVVAGRISTPEQAERLLAEGVCDVVGMARAFIADPEWPSKARAGRRADIRPCIGCNECHAFHSAGRGHMVCTVNPVATREAELTGAPAARPRTVLVAGGGPAGTEAALVAARRGHRVVLCECSERLGGQAALVARDPERAATGEWLAYQARQLAAAGVDVRLSTRVDRALVQELAPEVVVVATGARPRHTTFPGSDRREVVTAEAVLSEVVVPGGHVVVVGGQEEHLRPLATADLLARRGASVTVTSELLVVGRGVEERTLLQLMRRLLDAGASLRPLTAVAGFHGPELATRHVLTGSAGAVPGVDWVVLAEGGVADDTLAESLCGLGAQVHVIGDALAPRRMVHAVLEGARLAHIL